MPIYDVKCTECEYNCEVADTYENTRKFKCPKCGSETEIKIGNTSFQLLGGGWYNSGGY